MTNVEGNKVISKCHVCNGDIKWLDEERVSFMGSNPGPVDTVDFIDICSKKCLEEFNKSDTNIWRSPKEDDTSSVGLGCNICGSTANRKYNIKVGHVFSVFCSKECSKRAKAALDRECDAKIKIEMGKACVCCKAIAGKDSDKFKVCSRCRSVSYCSQTCQKTHWKVHKPDCKPVEMPD